MVPVRMGQKQMSVIDVFAQQPITKVANTGSRIEYQATSATGHFDATCIPAERNMFWRGGSDTASYAPELDFETDGPKTSRFASDSQSLLSSLKRFAGREIGQGQKAKQPAQNSQNGLSQGEPVSIKFDRARGMTNLAKVLYRRF